MTLIKSCLLYHVSVYKTGLGKNAYLQGLKLDNEFKASLYMSSTTPLVSWISFPLKIPTFSVVTCKTKWKVRRGKQSGYLHNEHFLLSWTSIFSTPNLYCHGILVCKETIPSLFLLSHFHKSVLMDSGHMLYRISSSQPW